MLSIFWEVTKDCYYYIDREFMEELEHFMKFPEEKFKAYSCHSKRMFFFFLDYKYEVLEYGFYSLAYEDFEPEEA